MVPSTGTPLHIACASGCTNSLRGFNTCVDVADGVASIFVDLDPNLRARDTPHGSFDDATALADRGIDDLRLIHFQEPDVANAIGRSLSRSHERCTLVLKLEREHSFPISPRWEPEGLVFHVLR